VNVSFSTPMIGHICSRSETCMIKFSCECFSFHSYIWPYLFSFWDMYYQIKSVVSVSLSTPMIGHICSHSRLRYDTIQNNSVATEKCTDVWPTSLFFNWTLYRKFRNDSPNLWANGGCRTYTCILGLLQVVHCLWAFWLNLKITKKPVCTNEMSGRLLSILWTCHETESAVGMI
jgi:hypothetical protein